MSWSHRKETMKMHISLCRRQDLPDFIHSTSALPSDVKSCTPRLQRAAPADHDVSAVTANLFPTSAQKVTLPRGSSDSGLSAAFSSSNSLVDGASGDSRQSPRNSAAVAALFPENALPHPPSLQASPRVALRSPLSMPSMQHGRANAFHDGPQRGLPLSAAPSISPSFGLNPAAGHAPNHVHLAVAAPAGGYPDTVTSPSSTEYYSPNGHVPRYNSREMATGAREASPGSSPHEYYGHPAGGGSYSLAAPRSMPFPAMHGASDPRYVAAAPPRHLVAPSYPSYASAAMGVPPPPPAHGHPQHHVHFSPPKRHRNEYLPGSQGSSGSGSGTENGHIRHSQGRRQKF
jgi:hypothetical protein